MRAHRTPNDAGASGKLLARVLVRHLPCHTPGPYCAFQEMRRVARRATPRKRLRGGCSPTRGFDFPARAEAAFTLIVASPTRRRLSC